MVVVGAKLDLGMKMGLKLTQWGAKLGLKQAQPVFPSHAKTMSFG